MRSGSGNPLVGSFAGANTVGWASWRTIPANMTEVTGTHTVYVESSSGAPGIPLACPHASTSRSPAQPWVPCRDQGTAPGHRDPSFCNRRQFRVVIGVGSRLSGVGIHPADSAGAR